MSRAGKVIGHAPCPYCGDKEAEVKSDKNGNPYIICFGSSAPGSCVKPSQHFTLGDPERIRMLLGGGKFRLLPGAEAPAWAVTPPALPAPGPSPKAPEKKRGLTMLGGDGE